MAACVSKGSDTPLIDILKATGQKQTAVEGFFDQLCTRESTGKGESMDEKIQEAIGLLRHKIISPVLMETGRAQMEYFRKASAMEFDVPGFGLRRFRPTTMKSWLCKYKKNGFTGLLPKKRRDAGHYRKLPEKMKEQILGLRTNHLSLSVVGFYEQCLSKEILGHPPICQATLRRYLKGENLFSKKEEPTARKRFEMSRFGELWTADFMHGPHVYAHGESKRKRKAILMAIIDDHSRMIVGAEFGFFENTILLEKVFKDAILTYGLCHRIYVDNGASFSSDYLRRVCAHLDIGLVHSKPYDSPSRGKIERFFRTVRERFLALIHPNTEITLTDLNERFLGWLRNDYHHKHHTGIDTRPIDRYQASLAELPLKRIDGETLDEFFMESIERTVNRDCTVSYNAIIYEVPPAYVGKRVELRFVQDNPNEVYLYEDKKRIQKLLPVDTKENARVYRPSDRDPHVPFHVIKNNKVNHD